MSLKVIKTFLITVFQYYLFRIILKISDLKTYFYVSYGNRTKSYYYIYLLILLQYIILMVFLMSWKKYNKIYNILHLLKVNRTSNGLEIAEYTYFHR